VGSRHRPRPQSDSPGARPPRAMRRACRSSSRRSRVRPAPQAVEDFDVSPDPERGWLCRRHREVDVLRELSERVRRIPSNLGYVRGRKRVVVKAPAVALIGAERRRICPLDRGRVAHDLQTTRVAEVGSYPAAEQIDQMGVAIARIDDRRGSAPAAPPRSTPRRRPRYRCRSAARSAIPADPVRSRPSSARPRAARDRHRGGNHRSHGRETVDSGRTARGQVEPDRRLAQARPSGPFQPQLPRGTRANTAARVDRPGSSATMNEARHLWCETRPGLSSALVF